MHINLTVNDTIYTEIISNICTDIKNCDWVRSPCICPPQVRVEHIYSQMDRQHQLGGCAKCTFKKEKIPRHMKSTALRGASKISTCVFVSLEQCIADKW